MANAPLLLTHPAVPPPQSFREQWLAWRNRLLASKGFQRWAAGFPLTRRIARRRSRALFDLVGGFVYSQILQACVRLHLFDHLAAGPRSVRDLAGVVALSDAAADRLLKAAAALDLTEILPDGRYALGHLGAALRGNPSVMAMIEHHALLYADLADPVALLRGQLPDPQLTRFWAYAASADPAAAPSDRVAAYSALMAETQALIAGELLDAFSLRGYRRLLDVGGGEGVFLAAAAARHPQLQVMLFDLPAVTERARARFEALGMASRSSVHPGSFFADSLPQGADIASLVRVLHDHNDDAAQIILNKLHDALPKGAPALIAEPMSGTRGAAPVGDAYFGFYLAAMGSGRPRTPDELAAMLKNAGFREVRRIPTRTPLVVSVMLARA